MLDLQTYEAPEISGVNVMLNFGWAKLEVLTGMNSIRYDPSDDSVVRLSLKIRPPGLDVIWPLATNRPALSMIPDIWPRQRRPSKDTENSLLTIVV